MAEEEVPVGRKNYAMFQVLIEMGDEGSQVKSEAVRRIRENVDDIDEENIQVARTTDSAEERSRTIETGTIVEAYGHKGTVVDISMEPGTQPPVTVRYDDGGRESVHLDELEVLD